MKKTLLLLPLSCLGASLLSGQSLLTNADFTIGADGKTGWSTYLNVFDSTGTTYKYGTSFGTDTATPLGGGALELEMHPGWSDAGNGPADLGDVMENNFYVDFGGTPAFAGETVVFSGNFSVTTPFDVGNTGTAFIKILDTSWSTTTFLTADVSTSGGVFQLTSVVPVGGINAFQVGFAVMGPAGSAGSMTVSNLSLVAVPEPSVLPLLGGLALVGFIFGRRRR